jgi:hypothetical protein
MARTKAQRSAAAKKAAATRQTKKAEQAAGQAKRAAGRIVKEGKTAASAAGKAARAAGKAAAKGNCCGHGARPESGDPRHRSWDLRARRFGQRRICASQNLASKSKSPSLAGALRQKVEAAGIEPALCSHRAWPPSRGCGFQGTQRSPAGVTTSSCVRARGLCPTRNHTESATWPISARASRG